MTLFFFNDTATTEIYTLSLHDALPICWKRKTSIVRGNPQRPQLRRHYRGESRSAERDRKSTRLNSSHSQISYAVFCLKKKIDLPAKERPLTLNTKHVARLRISLKKNDT